MNILQLQQPIGEQFYRLKKSTLCPLYLANIAWLNQ